MLFEVENTILINEIVLETRDTYIFYANIRHRNNGSTTDIIRICHITYVI